MACVVLVFLILFFYDVLWPTLWECLGEVVLGDELGPPHGHLAVVRLSHPPAPRHLQQRRLPSLQVRRK